MALEVLVVDDEADIRELVAGVLEDEGYSVRTAADSSGALEAIEDRRPSLVLLDVWLQGSRLDGLQLLEQVKTRDPTLPVAGRFLIDKVASVANPDAYTILVNYLSADEAAARRDRAARTSPPAARSWSSNSHRGLLRRASRRRPSRRPRPTPRSTRPPGPTPPSAARRRPCA